MREGWEYKKYQWSEILTIINGKNQSAVVNDNGEYPIYGSGGIMGYADDYLCPEECVIIGRKGNINKPLFVTTKFWNVDTAFGLNADRKHLLPKYLFYFCLDYNFEQHNKAVTIPSLTKADLLKIGISLPSIEHQLAIVSELDKINELIRLKKEQLIEYDNLAQSIFYDMFGDPVENEKGWEVKKLIDVCTKITDGTHDTPQRLTEGVKFITGKHIRPGYIDYMNSDYVTEQVHKEIYARCNPEFGDVLYTNIGANLANAAINTVHYEFSMKNVALLKLRKDVIHGMLLQFYLNNPRIREKILENYSNGGAQKFLSLKSIALIKTILPPLPLQQSFASRIEQIEKLKSEVQNAITDLETLLASRMQYWFE